MAWAIAAIVILGASLLYALSALRCIVIFPPSFTLQQHQSAGMEAVLLYKPWFRRILKRTQGTITIISPPSSVVQVAPLTAGTSHAAAATFIVTGVNVGTGKFKVNGKSRHGSHDTVEVSVTVTAPPG